MKSQESRSEECNKIEESDLSLIHGLPDDIAVLCLARVPRHYHHVLRCVSRRWRDLLSSEEWLSCRQKNNLMETWIYALCRDNATGKNCLYALDPEPARRCWKVIQPIPPQCLEREGMCFELLGNKLWLLGGCGLQEDATDEVYCYDASVNKWEKGVSMPMPRCYFVSAILDGELLVTGGTGMRIGSEESWDIYNPHTKSWSSCKVAMPVHDIVKPILLDGQIYTIHKAWNFRYAGVYDPSSNRWKRANDDLASHRGPMLVIDGTLYMLDEYLGTRLIKWHKGREEWEAMGRLSHHVTRPPCQLVAIGRNIFIIGQGLSTVVINVDTAAKVEGMLVGTSFFPNDSIDITVISCKAITI